MAAAQGRIAGLSASRYLGLITAADAAAQLDAARAALSQAREQALPIMPEAARGLGRMAELWAAARA